MEFRVVILLLVVPVILVGCTDPRCCVERQFVVDMVGTQITAESGTYVQVANIWLPTAIDVDGERIGSEGYMQLVGGQNITVKYIWLWKGGKSYFYTILDGKCSKATLPGAMPSNCIPDNATFRGYSTHGKDEFTTRSFELREEMSDLVNITYYISVSNRTCAPVSLVQFQVDQAAPYQTREYMSIEYVNYTSGIRDPKKWFAVPSSCGYSHHGGNEMKDSDSSESKTAMEILKKIKLLF